MAEKPAVLGHRFARKDDIAWPFDLVCQGEGIMTGEAAARGPAPARDARERRGRGGKRLLAASGSAVCAVNADDVKDFVKGGGREEAA